ncbi:uncharacterized protein [Nicotiana sylvestris]|uniref:uncharacterized protein n=1 Tax=Nicotiana sylvestris TaxID=4096 RepID=UPI00388C9C2D
MEHRTWMYNRNYPNWRGLREDFVEGVDDFIRHAMSLPPSQSEGVIRFPCVRCDCMKFEKSEVVKFHLYRKGFIENYFVWTNQEEIDGICGIFHNMVVGESSRSVENTNLDSRIHDMLEKASRPLRKGSPHSELSVAVRLLSIKSDWNISQAAMDSFIDLMSELVDPNIKLPGDFYKAKRLVSKLRLSSMGIDCCENGCMLYYKDDATLNSCKFCKKPPFKRLSSGNMVAIKVTYYLPLIPSLKRLYALMCSAPHMRWHFENRRPPGVMCHPSDGEAWKHFDWTYPDFASELRNIQLGEEIWETVQNFSKVTEAPPYRFPGYGVTHNWKKQSIFWELPYWKDNLLCHNLYVMHIEKNYFDNFFNTVMDVKGKTKDNLKARMDLQEYCRRLELYLQTTNNGKVFKTKSSYTFTLEERRQIRDWVTKSKMSEGYASNLGKKSRYGGREVEPFEKS